MNVSELSWQYIALELAEQESIISQSYARKKELLAELEKRKEYIREQYRRGEINIERSENE